MPCVGTCCVVGTCTQGLMKDSGDVGLSSEILESALAQMDLFVSSRRKPNPGEIAEL